MFEKKDLQGTKYAFVGGILVDKTNNDSCVGVTHSTVIYDGFVEQTHTTVKNTDISDDKFGTVDKNDKYGELQLRYMQEIEENDELKEKVKQLEEENERLKLEKKKTFIKTKLVENKIDELEEKRKNKMREILFRGKRSDNGEWVYGYYVVRGGMPFIFSFAKEPQLVIPETVGQYTGLKDKNGKEIYEGDILKFSDVDTAIVKWNKEYASFIVKPSEDYYFDDDILGKALYYNKDIEVMGNIYEGGRR